MQSSEGGSDTTTSVAVLRTSSSAQAPVVQPVPASQQVEYYLYPAATVMTGQIGKVCNDTTVPFNFFPNVEFQMYKRPAILETKPATYYISAYIWCLKRNSAISWQQISPRSTCSSMFHAAPATNKNVFLIVVPICKLSATEAANHPLCQRMLLDLFTMLASACLIRPVHPFYNSHLKLYKSDSAVNTIYRTQSAIVLQ